MSAIKEFPRYDGETINECPTIWCLNKTNMTTLVDMSMWKGEITHGPTSR